jgi:predicted NUDIX family phosphoesterase
MILTLPRTHAPALPKSDCCPIANLDFMRAPVWRERSEVEHDENFLQPIVYLALQDVHGQAWCYQRTGGDTRLDGRCSCGVGGHVDCADSASEDPFNADDTLQTALLREVGEELKISPNELTQVRSTLQLRGLIYEGLSPMGRVHLGVLYTAQCSPQLPPQPRFGEKLEGLGFMSLATIANEPRFELWSRLVAKHLLNPEP